jgi:hypothetical protein
MQTNNDTTTETQPQQPNGEGLDGAICSAYIWYPISTAPKDGTKIMTKLNGINGSIISFWTGDLYGWAGWAVVPSHWRPTKSIPNAERIREIAMIDAENLPRKQGDMLGSLQWFDARTGKTRRWIIRIGDRIDRITVESPGTNPTKSHGWTWFMSQLRSKICR